jgi:hypothetical protein
MGRNHRRTPDGWHAVAIAAASLAVDQRCLGGYERSQMISSAIGRPIPNEPPMINAIAKSKPSPARNSCHDIPLLLQGRCPRIHLTVVVWAGCVNDSRPNVVLSAGAAIQRRLASKNAITASALRRIRHSVGAVLLAQRDKCQSQIKKPLQMWRVSDVQLFVTSSNNLAAHFIFSTASAGQMSIDLRPSHLINTEPENRVQWVTTPRRVAHSTPLALAVAEHTA